MSGQIEVVELTEDEQRLYDSIIWDANTFMQKDHAERLAILENQKTLVVSLLDRKAIPEIRIRWFSDPDLNLAGRGKSRRQVFEDNGCKGEDILRHPHFRPHLWYFVHGPKLSKATIEGFCKIIGDDTGDLFDQIAAFVRKQMRDQRLDHDAPDEFTKLAFELGRSDLAESVRSAAKSVRK